MIAAPPLDAGAVHHTTAEASPPDAFTLRGRSGTVPGVTAVEAAEAAELPWALVATTVKVYAVPLVKRLMRQVVAVVVLQVRPPGEEVTV